MLMHRFAASVVDTVLILLNALLGGRGGGRDAFYEKWDGGMAGAFYAKLLNMRSLSVSCCLSLSLSLSLLLMSFVFF